MRYRICNGNNESINVCSETVSTSILVEEDMVTILRIIHDLYNTKHGGLFENYFYVLILIFSRIFLIDITFFIENLSIQIQ